MRKFSRIMQCLYGSFTTFKARYCNWEKLTLCFSIRSNAHRHATMSHESRSREDNFNVVQVKRMRLDIEISNKVGRKWSKAELNMSKKRSREANSIFGELKFLHTVPLHPLISPVTIIAKFAKRPRNIICEKQNLNRPISLCWIFSREEIFHRKWP